MFLYHAIENEIRYKRTNGINVNNDMARVRHAFKLNGYFTMQGSPYKFETIRFFKDSEELEFYIDASVDKYDDPPIVYHTGNIYRQYRRFRHIR